ncbi:MAG: hypothetical protein ACFFDF_21610 [Candidatus Odinarchaeota archaeon]
MNLDNQFIEEISQFKTIYCHVSGGVHTSAIAYKLYDLGFENVSLIHNLTYLEYPECLKIIQKIIFDTDYSYNVIPPNLKGRKFSEIMKASFLAIPSVVKGLKSGIIKTNNVRDYIPCCRLLKKTSSRKWYTKNIDKKTSVVIMAICPYESKNRKRHLTELREMGTFLRLHKKHGNVWHGYPFRDAFNEYPFYEYLLGKGIMPIHSGCQICPIRIIFNMAYEGDKSILYYKNILKKEISSQNILKDALEVNQETIVY